MSNKGENVPVFIFQREKTAAIIMCKKSVNRNYLFDHDYFSNFLTSVFNVYFIFRSIVKPLVRSDEIMVA